MAVVTHVNIYPCLDEMRRYRSFPCSECQAPTCVFGKKPKRKVELEPGQKRCQMCQEPFWPGSGTLAKRRYCSVECRDKRRNQRRRARRVGGEAVYSV